MLLTLLPVLLVSLGADLPKTDLQQILLDKENSQHLPLRFARTVAIDLDIVVHGETSLALAHFAPQPLPFLHPSAPTGPPPEPVSTRPVLYLRESAYQNTGQPIPLTELTVDSADYLFHELVRAYLQLHVVGKGEAYSQLLQRRSSKLLSEVPERARMDAYLNALAAFGGHSMSVANQLERSSRLYRKRDSDFCRQAKRPFSLFGAWENIFQSERYVARYYLPAAEGELLGRWVSTKVALEPEDKRLFLHHVLDDFWKGERQADLMQRYCPDTSPAEKSSP